MDKIIIDGIEASCIIGTREEERTTPQLLLISAVLHCNMQAAAKSDDLQDAVNYVHCIELIQKTTATTSFFLLERLGDEICQKLLAVPGVSAVDLCIEKPQAVPGVQIAIEMTRRRSV